MFEKLRTLASKGKNAQVTNLSTGSNVETDPPSVSEINIRLPTATTFGVNTSSDISTLPSLEKGTTNDRKSFNFFTKSDKNKVKIV